MLHDISELRNKPLEYIRNFLTDLHAEEKIDAYYISIEIQSKNNLVFHKSNNKLITREDTIINEMWSLLISDWQHFKLVNEDWFEKHIGNKISMFYLPSRKPLLTEYKDGITYIIDRIENRNGELTDAESEMKDMNMLSEFHIKFKRQLILLYDIEETVEKLKNASAPNTPEEDFNNIFESLIDKNSSVIYAENTPEGYIFKNGKYIFQLRKQPQENRTASAEKTQYEYLLLSFIRFWQNNDLTTLLDHSYVKTVCHLFNIFINNYEKQTRDIENNIEADSLQSPCIGQRFDICYKNIPDEITISLCKENELYKNIFKVLLVNLKRKKDARHCVLMNQKYADEWNEIVQIIQNTII